MSDETLMECVKALGALADTFRMAIAGGDSDFMGAGERITYVPEAELLRVLRRLKAAEAALRVRGEWHIGRPSDLDESGACTCCLVTKNAADAYFAVHGAEVEDANT